MVIRWFNDERMAPLSRAAHSFNHQGIIEAIAHNERSKFFESVTAAYYRIYAAGRPFGRHLPLCGATAIWHAFAIRGSKKNCVGA
jgi:hypothetical protein